MFFLRLLTILSILLTSTLALAKPITSFHEGPYIRIIGGVISASFDDNARTGTKVNGDYEGVYGFQFGWNLWDSTAAELEAKYATKKWVARSREHIVNVNLNIKYSFVTNSLTNLGTLNILPFVSGGPAAIIAAVPGDPLTNYKLMSVWGIGLGAGAGIDFLFKQYVYFGFKVQGDIHYIPSVSQTVSGTSQKIITGGWEPQLSIIGAAGIHF